MPRIYQQYSQDRCDDSSGNCHERDLRRRLQPYFSTFGQMYSVMDVWQEMLPGENGEAVNPMVKSRLRCALR
ncbi:MAG: hypothetical protein V8T45_06425 [Oscillospiraceae bacterium]